MTHVKIFFRERSRPRVLTLTSALSPLLPGREIRTARRAFSGSQPVVGFVRDGAARSVDVLAFYLANQKQIDVYLAEGQRAAAVGRDGQGEGNPVAAFRLNPFVGTHDDDRRIRGPRRVDRPGQLLVVSPARWLHPKDDLREIQLGRQAVDEYEVELVALGQIPDDEPLRRVEEARGEAVAGAIDDKSLFV